MSFPAVDDAGKDPADGADGIGDGSPDPEPTCAELDCDDDNPCTADRCADDACVHSAVAGSCADDGNPCTQDVCTGIACTHPANGTCQCKTDGECDDDNPCTDDTCGEDRRCANTNNAAGCAPDDTMCTNDVCVEGVCTHPDNGVCECRTAAECDDDNACTDDSCDASGQCVNANNSAPCAADTDACTCDVCSAGVCGHLPEAMCDDSPAQVINSFDSASDWDMGLTTPGARAITGKSTFDLTNLEGNTSLYLAESSSGTLEFVAPSLFGLTELTIEISSDQASTASMVKLGVLGTGTTYSDRSLATYGTIPQGSFATIAVPLADFGVPPCQITKVRIDIAATGGQKIWRIRDLSAR